MLWIGSWLATRDVLESCRSNDSIDIMLLLKIIECIQYRAQIILLLIITFGYPSVKLMSRIRMTKKSLHFCNVLMNAMVVRMTHNV